MKYLFGISIAGRYHGTDRILQFQEEEAIYAKEVAETLGIPLKVSAGANDLENTLDFVQETMRRVNDGW